MCDFHNLYTSDKGFVLRCKKCGYYQIGFAGLMLSLNEEDYQHLGEIIRHLAAKELPSDAMESRHIVIPSPYYGVNLLLCHREIQVFERMLGEANSETITQSMLALFKQA